MQPHNDRDFQRIRELEQRVEWLEWYVKAQFAVVVACVSGVSLFVWPVVPMAIFAFFGFAAVLLCVLALTHRHIPRFARWLGCSVAPVVEAISGNPRSRNDH